MAFVRLHLQHDWLAVIGQCVEIRRGHTPVRTGVVDSVTDDGSILWIAAHGVHPRMMIERALGFQVWVSYKWDTQR